MCPISPLGSFFHVADALGVAHPPGYPLFTMMGKFFILLLAPIQRMYASFGRDAIVAMFGPSALPLVEPLGVAWRMNFMAVLMGTAASGILFWVLCRITRNHLPTAVCLSAFFTFRLCHLYHLSPRLFISHVCMIS